MCRDPPRERRSSTCCSRRRSTRTATRGWCSAIRADFFAAVRATAALAPVLQTATVVVGPMTDDELQAAVTGPAAAVGLSVERALLTQLAADVRGQPGALPMLSHALLETWRERRSATLTVAGYLATGGMARRSREPRSRSSASCPRTSNRSRAR